MRQSNDTAWRVAFLVLLVVSTIADGAVMARLWSWFVVPLGLPSIGVAHAVGLSVFVAMRATLGTSDDKRSIYDRFVDTLLGAIGRFVAALGLGYLAHLAMVNL